MNEIATTEFEKTQHATSLTLAMDPNSMEKMLRVAEIMAAGRATVPKHLQNNVPDCLAVTMQAMTWGMSPFVVGQKTHLVNGTLGYEAQLVNAVVQASGAINGRFHYEYEGKSPSLLCRVGAVIKGESDITWGMWLNERDVATKNSPLWKVNPPQQMGYLQVKNWARLYTPGAILGVYTPDEIETFKPPRDMGNANVVPPDTLKALTDRAESAAAKGMAGYQEFWKKASKEDRKLLAGEHEQLKAKANKVDASRTIQEPTGEITFEDAVKKLNDAANEDALNIAQDLAISIDLSEDQLVELNILYDKRLAELRGQDGV